MQKTLVIPIEQDSRLDDLLRVWREQVVYCSQKCVEIGSYSMIRLQRAVYKKLREKYLEYNSQIIVNAYKFASEAVKSCIKLCRSNKRTRFPSLSKVQSIHLRKEDLSFDGEKIKVIYKPRERIEIKVFPSDKQKKIMKELRGKGGRLVKKDNRWMLHLIVEKEVFLPRWEQRRSIIGVDIGMNYLAVCSALTENGFSNPLFIKGKEWKHLQLKKRAKLRALQSRGANTDEKWRYFNNRFNEILHKTTKKVVEYAKQFEKPIIVLEDLGKMHNGSKSKKWNFLLGNWARRKLQEYIRYKAEWEGIPVVKVYPHYTSKTCHFCGSRGTRKVLVFKCLGCGREYNADSNAAMNLALRFAKNIRHPLAMRGISHRQSSMGEAETHMAETALNSTCMEKMNLMRLTEGEPC